MLDSCTWGLPHVSVRVAELRVPGVRKEEANFWTCLNTLPFPARSWKNVFLQCLTFCFREGVLPSYAVKLTGTFRSFWVLEKHVRPLHLGSAPSLRVAELGATGKLGAPGLQSEKRRGKLLNMFEHFVFSCALMEECFFCNVWLLNMGLCCASLLCFCFREGGLSSYLVKLAGTFLSLWVLEKHVRPLHLGSAPLITYHWGWPNLGRRVSLGHLDFRVRRGKLLNMFEHFVWSRMLMKVCILAIFGMWPALRFWWGVLACLCLCLGEGSKKYL